MSPAPQAAPRYARFGKFELRWRPLCLLRDERELDVQEQTLRLLATLVLAKGEVVAREKLYGELWPPGVHVDFEQGLNTAVKKLRAVFQDRSDQPRFIETVPKAGYRFIAPMELTWDKSEDQPAAMEGLLPAHPPGALGKAGSNHRPWQWWLAAVACVLAALVALLIWKTPVGQKSLAPRQRLLLAEIVNQTGNPNLDETVREVLAAKLSDSPHISLLPYSHIRDTLELMKEDRERRLTEDVARQICIRQGLPAFVTGSIAGSGDVYHLTVRVISASNGELVTQFQRQIRGENAVIPEVSLAGDTLRRELGETWPAAATEPLPLVTTRNLEALRFYAFGIRSPNEVESLEALNKAIELDHNFAMAYHALAAWYGYNRELGKAKQMMVKARELAPFAGHRERFLIESDFYAYHDQLVKERDTLRTWVQVYPDDVDARERLGFLLIELGDPEGARAEGRELLRLAPSSALSYELMTGALLHLKEPDEALAMIGTAKQRGIACCEYKMLDIAFARNDLAEIKRQSAILRDKDPIQFRSIEARTFANHGQLGEARRRLTLLVHELRAKKDKVTWAARSQITLAFMEAMVGENTRAQAAAREAMQISLAQEVIAGAAEVLAMIGDANEAVTLAGRVTEAEGGDSVWRLAILPCIRSANALRLGRPAEAVQSLESAREFDFTQEYRATPPYFRGKAYLANGEPEKAAKEFHAMIEHKGLAGADWYLYVVVGQYWYAKALALAAEQSGRNDLAVASRKAYAEFLKIWAGGDPDVAILKLARREAKELAHVEIR